jgi:competence ComEA-like helix-hairpin-helix protein
MDPVANSHTPDPVGSPTEEATLGLRRSDQWFVGVFAIAGLLLLAVHAFHLTGWGRPSIEIDRLPARQYDYQLDVNRATWIEWTLLEGIGEKLAHRIVADREARGPFAKLEDVRRVPGIGPKTWEQIRPWLTISTEQTAAPAPATP